MADCQKTTQDVTDRRIILEIDARETVSAIGSRRVASAARAMRMVALGREKDIFVGSHTGGNSAAIACTMIETAKLTGVDPQDWLADISARIPDHKTNRIDDPLSCYAS